MASCEPKPTSAYSEDLHWRVVYQRYGLELSYREIPKNLNVDHSTVCRTIEYPEYGLNYGLDPVFVLSVLSERCPAIDGPVG